MRGLSRSFDERIKIDYNNPEKLTIILSDKKGVYINHKLQESEFFLTKIASNCKRNEFLWPNLLRSQRS